MSPRPSTPTCLPKRWGGRSGSKEILENFADGPVRALAWREGTPLGADRRADAALAAAGYELLFANHAVQQIPQISRPSAGRS